MTRDRHLIITPDGIEKTVYSVCEQDLCNVLRITLLEIFSLKDIQSPKIQHFQTMINSPIKILKSKNNLQLQTSVVVSMNDIVFECKTQMPCDLHHRSLWKPLCEDMIQLNISHKSFKDLHFSIFAVKNIVSNTHYYFTDMFTLQKLQQLSFMLNCFLEENYIKKSFTQVYKKIMSNHCIDDIIDTIENKIFLKDNILFLMTCISEYKQPDMLLAAFLQKNILPKTWHSGEEFFQQFSYSLATYSQYIKEIMIHTYDKFILYMHLNNNLTCQNKTKCVKI